MSGFSHALRALRVYYTTKKPALYTLTIKLCCVICQQHVHMLTAGLTPIMIIKGPYSSYRRDWLIGTCAYQQEICAYYVYALISGY